MADIEQLYPPSPKQVPPELTSVTVGYRARVLLTVAALAVFVACYLALLYGAYRLAVWLWNRSVTSSGEFILYAFILKYGSLLAVCLFFLFLLRPLFKWRPATTGAHVEISRDSAPTLFAFLDRLCAEIGAPRPYRVVADYSVNAAVIYDVSILSLIVPPKKQLLIGFGLVNVLNLSELKAVLAHEFGHFSQKSTRVGSYVYVAQRVIYDLIFGRDQLDEWLEVWCQQDLRLSLPAWILVVALNSTRWLLARIYGFVMRVYLGLTRQMEFNADDVAVSVAGSDAILHGLYKMDFAGECLQTVAEQLIFAADQGIYTDDMFFHQTQVAERERRRRGDPRYGLPPALPEEPHGKHQIFEPTDEDRNPDPYATHPTLYQREQNAKRIYVPCPIDERSAWLVFDNAEEARKEVTAAFYRAELDRDPVTMRPAEEVQRFIDAELAERETLDRYQGFFGFRSHFPCNPDELLSEAVLEPQEIASFLDGWPDEKTLNLGKQHRETVEKRDGLFRALVAAVSEAEEEVRLEGGETVSVDELRQRLRDLDNDLTALESCLHELDRRFLQVHLSVARHLDSVRSAEAGELSRLLERLKLQHTLDRVTKRVERIAYELTEVLADLRALADEVDDKKTEEAGKRLADRFYKLREELKTLCGELRTLQLPELSNIAEGTTAHDIVVAPLGIQVPKRKGRFPSFEEFMAVTALAYQMIPRLRRLQAKAIAAFVGHCERLASAWSEHRTNPAAATSVSEGNRPPQVGRRQE